MNGAAKLTQPDLRTLGHDGNVLDANGRAVFGQDDGVFECPVRCGRARPRER